MFIYSSNLIFDRSVFSTGNGESMQYAAEQVVEEVLEQEEQKGEKAPHLRQVQKSWQEEFDAIQAIGEQESEYDPYAVYDRIDITGTGVLGDAVAFFDSLLPTHRVGAMYSALGVLKLFLPTDTRR